MGVLNDCIRHLPTLKDCPKAVSVAKKGNIPFDEAYLAAIVLASVLMTWQNQYNLTHLTVPKSMRVLLPDLEAIEWVMVEKQNKKLNAKVKATPARPDAKSNPKRKCLGARLIESQKRVAVRSFASLAKPTAVPTRPTTPWTAVSMTAMVSSLRQQQVSPLIPRSPTRSFGATRVWPLCRPCSRPM